MNKREVWELLCQLKLVFDIVRLVDVSVTRQVSVDGTGEIKEEPYHCYKVWNKEARCENCVSAKALNRRGKVTKFEFIGQEIYYVIAKYLEVEGRPYVLEIVSHVTDETLFGAYGKGDFENVISNYNKKLYIDPVTEAYNRQYYEEQLIGLTCVGTVAMMDADTFKNINDTFGHHAGDLALQSLAHTVLSCVRNTDVLVRYGGDEFLLILYDIPKGRAKSKLEEIREKIGKTVISEYPSLKLSVSIGGIYSRGKLEDMVMEADKMLYEAKKQKNCVSIEYDSEETAGETN